MNDGDALLAAIIANPDDDTPRLVYADWLDEHGQPERAEFIRLQCNQASSDTDETDERMISLEHGNRPKWLAGLPQFADVSWEFRRGFPEIVGAPGSLFLERYDAFARVPWLRGISLWDLDNSAVRDFASRPWNPRWVELSLQEEPNLSGITYGYDSGPALVAIAHCTQVRQLSSLRLSLFTITPAAAHELAESPYLTQLQELRLEGDPDSPLFTPLRERFGDHLVIEQV